MEQHGQKDALGRRHVGLIHTGGGEILGAVKEPVEQFTVFPPQGAIEPRPLLTVLLQHLIYSWNGSTHSSFFLYLLCFVCLLCLLRNRQQAGSFHGSEQNWLGAMGLKNGSGERNQRAQKTSPLADPVGRA